jgi:hypothetical protein
MENDKIIVRNKVYRKGEINSKFVMLTSDTKVPELEVFKKRYGMKSIMKDLFDEEIEDDNFEKTLIFSKYEEIVDSGKDNEYFHTMYKIKDDLAAKLSEHIHLHHIVRGLEVNGKRILPWECIDSKIYIADTWWETDGDILKDICNMTYVEFLSKYKAY